VSAESETTLSSENYDTLGGPKYGRPDSADVFIHKIQVIAPRRPPSAIIRPRDDDRIRLAEDICEAKIACNDKATIVAAATRESRL
jgi:hypothetical protein